MMGPVICHLFELVSRAASDNWHRFATYIHCSGHCLNLVIAKSCSLPAVRNMLERCKHCWRYFLNNPKRSNALEHVVTKNVPYAGKRKPLLGLCKTCWAERHSAYQHFNQAFIYIVDTLEMIAFKRHLDKYGYI